MDKLTLYKKGGVLYYKKGGKMCKYEGGGPIRYRLPKYQNSGYVTDEIAPVNIGQGSGYQLDNPYMEKVIDRNVPNVDQSYTKSKPGFNQIAGYAQGLGSMMSAFTPNKQFNYDNKYEQGIGMAAQKANSTAGGIKSGITGAIGAIPGWGQAVSGLINTGTGISNMVKNKDKYGISQSDAQDAIGNAISPSESWSDAIKGVSKHGAAGIPDILKNIFLPGIPIASHTAELDRQQVARAKKEGQWDKDRQEMFNSESTGQYRNDTIYAKNGAQIKKSANHNPNAEIETGEVVMMPDGVDTSKTVMNPRANTSMVSDKAFLVTGKTHEQGGETGNFPQGTYIFSDHLGIDGNKAGKGTKTVAQLAKPHAKALSQMEKRPTDRYLNNPKAKQFHENQLDLIAGMAEQGKQQAEQNNMFKNAIKTAKSVSNNGLQYAQKGGILQDYVVNKMKVDPTFVKKAVSDDPMNYKFNNPDLYKGREFDSYQDEEIIPAENTPLDINVEEGVNLGMDERQGDRPDITTLDAQAGKSKYSGTSNLIQEKVREMIDNDFFDENGSIAPQWKQKLKSDYDLSDDEVNKATMETITEGRVGKTIGKLLQDAYGVLGKGKDEQSRLVETNINRLTDRPVINNKLDWAEDIVGQIKKNGNILPSQYQSLPDDLKDTLTQLARTGKRASEGSFSPSLDRAYRQANESVASEVDRQKSMTYDTQSQEGAKLDSNYDLYYNRKDGSVQSFGAAFREAKDGGLDEFTYKGKKYAAKTRSEDPTLAKASDAIKGTQSTKPINQLNIQPAVQGRAVVNPTRKLETLQSGGNINTLNNNNMNFNKRPLLSSYQTGGYNSLSAGDQAKYNAILKARNSNGYISPINQDWFNSVSNSQLKGSNEKPVYSTTPLTTINPAGSFNKSMQTNQMNNLSRMMNSTAADNWDMDNQMKQQRMNDAFMQSRMNSGNNPDDITKKKYGQEAKIMFQMGGEMPAEQMPNESNAHMQQLMSGDPAAVQEEAMEQPAQGQGQMPVQITQLEPALQEMFMQLSPEQQQQILALPPDQIEIALMTLMQQMAGGQGQPQGQPAQQPQMGGMSQVPAGVMEQLG